MMRLVGENIGLNRRVELTLRHRELTVARWREFRSSHGFREGQVVHAHKSQTNICLPV